MNEEQIRLTAVNEAQKLQREKGDVSKLISDAKKIEKYLKSSK